MPVFALSKVSPQDKLLLDRGQLSEPLRLFLLALHKAQQLSLLLGVEGLLEDSVSSSLVLKVFPTLALYALGADAESPAFQLQGLGLGVASQVSDKVCFRRFVGTWSCALAGKS